jgi:rfaE bifunctional protein kinase chain/domain
LKPSADYGREIKTDMKKAVSIKIDKGRFKEIIDRFPGKRILVVGDVMLDEFVFGSVSRISPEAPVPVVLLRSKTTHLGGAGNVGCNLSSLGAVPMPVGLIGDCSQDAASDQILKEYRKYSKELGGLISEAGRHSTVKTRIIAHHQQICRTDLEDFKVPGKAAYQGLVHAIQDLSICADATIISDYAKGVVQPELIGCIHRCKGRNRNRVLAVDPKVRDMSFYGPATVLTPNKHEAELATNSVIQDETSLLSAGRKILRKAPAQYLLITRGEEGMSVFERRGPVTHIPTMAQEVFDVTGAGDTVIATLTLALAAGAGMVEAAMIANYAAGIVVGKLGTATATAKELLERIEHEY